MASTIENIKAQMLAVLPTYKECLTSWLGDGSIYFELENYLKSNSADEAILFTHNKFGVIPINPGYPGHYNSCGGYVANVYNYTLSIKYYLKYANFSLNDSNNCQKIKEQLEALEVEKLNGDKQFTADQNRYRHSSFTMIIGEIQSNLLSAYSSMSCSTRLNETKQQQTLSALSAATNESQSKEITSNNIIYIIAAVVILAIVIKILKR